MEKWDDPPMDDNVETNAHNVKVGALIFFIWSAAMMVLGISIGVYLVH